MKIKEHSALTTPFWQAAYQSLPKEVRGRYLAHFESAERWELGLDATLEAVSRAKALITACFAVRASDASSSSSG